MRSKMIELIEKKSMDYDRINDLNYNDDYCGVMPFLNKLLSFKNRHNQLIEENILNIADAVIEDLNILKSGKKLNLFGFRLPYEENILIRYKDNYISASKFCLNLMAILMVCANKDITLKNKSIEGINCARELIDFFLGKPHNKSVDDIDNLASNMIQACQFGILATGSKKEKTYFQENKDLQYQRFSNIANQHFNNSQREFSGRCF